MPPMNMSGANIHLTAVDDSPSDKIKAQLMVTNRQLMNQPGDHCPYGSRNPATVTTAKKCCAMSFISIKYLISTLPRKQNLNLLASDIGQNITWYRRSIPQRLIESLNRFRPSLEYVFGTNRYFSVLCTHVFSYHPLVNRLIERLFTHPN